MLIQTLLNRVHAVKGFVYDKVELAADVSQPHGVHLAVCMRHRRRSRGVCSGCGRRGPTYDTRCGDLLTTLEVDEHMPVWMEPNMQRRFQLPRCAEPAGLHVTVQLVLERPAGGDGLPPLGLSFNDSWPSFDSDLSDELLEPTGSLTHHVPENVALNYTFPATLIREGWNDMVVAHGGMAADLADRRRQGIMLVGIELLVEPARRSAMNRT